MIAMVLVAALCFSSSFALRIISPEGNAQPNTFSNFSVVNQDLGAPVRLQVHDSNGNILSNSEGVTGTPISLYVPQTT